MRLTEQQRAVVDAARCRANLVAIAYAGAGKTSTLRELARAMPSRGGVYLAYNRAIAVDASRSFPSTVVCKTAHAFAFAAVGRDYKHRLDAPRKSARVTAELLGIREPLALGSDVPKLAPQQVARLAMAAVDRFCQSADDLIEPRHLPKTPGFEEPAARAALTAAIVPIARRAWEDITRINGRLRFSHDAYLKLWQLSSPDLRADYVLLDEAQDSNPAVAAVVERQACQRILVGDPYQAIYGWRGAVDAMDGFDGQRLHLSQSFRFGPAVAAEANKWLSLLGAELPLVGFDAIDSRIERGGPVDAILCRTNGGALTEVIWALDAGMRVALVGGGDDLRRYAEAAQRLMRGEPCDHPELVGFSTWREVQEYAEQDASDLAVIVRLIDKYRPEIIIQMTARLVTEDRAELVISTAHKAKGREWHRVRIADDFVEPRPNEETGIARLSREDAMLAYVAVTRAQYVLDRTGLAWVDHWTAGMTRRPAPTRDVLGLRDAPVVPVADLGDVSDLDDEDSPAVPVAPVAVEHVPLHPGTCYGLCTEVKPNRCLYDGPHIATPAPAAPPAPAEPDPVDEPAEPDPVPAPPEPAGIAMTDDLRRAAAILRHLTATGWRPVPRARRVHPGARPARRVWGLPDGTGGWAQQAVLTTHGRVTVRVPTPTGWRHTRYAECASLADVADELVNARMLPLSEHTAYTTGRQDQADDVIEFAIGRGIEDILDTLTSELHAADTLAAVADDLAEQLPLDPHPFERRRQAADAVDVVLGRTSVLAERIADRLPTGGPR